MQFNRAFKYGDGLFETIRVRDGKLLYLNDHFARLSKGLEILQMQKIGQPFTFYEFQKILKDFIAIQSDVNLRIRITFFRQEGGLYTPQKHSFDYQIEATRLENTFYELNTQGLKIGLCTSVQLPMGKIANLKTISALPYVLAGLEKKKNAWDDCLILNVKGSIAESIAANVFVLAGQQLYTPALTEGCIEGVMRRQVIRLAKEEGLILNETSLQLELLEQAQELFLTNAIQGIQWVEQLVGYPQKMNNAISKQLFQRLIQK